ncbi:RdgB/HAM1 family non-canonical purine NTP pyrophosphatase [Rubrobacter taiwanensis]|jgi:XTP/dITP diphosphohydrolase|uniref:RdgB/HAM1 family non-canonical purine NTP pyrophosphatase n=1 Tax=Rubrobacter taiwanensis TaxID=185139 RepID=A0A4R1BGR7_9ACTN|nr:RdgB/HAM1 family non-canonical purine NTP pyrophosphatase [Rubrobacter taiwanensis]TCJ16400.1 RdgB/HAM1 family non-canonical purine NTP pyrophosphatase [Rubrobacter taiwanensis]
MERIIFVTSNRNKAREAGRILGLNVEPVPLDVPEIQSLDLEAVARAKVRAACEALGDPDLPVLAEDSGLAVNAWNGFPGALTRWLMQSVGNEGLLRMLSGYEDRSARALCVVAVAHEGSIHTFWGEVEGEIAPEPRGSGGFGYDPVFIPAGQSRTYAELGELKNELSHRARALRAVREWLGSP